MIFKVDGKKLRVEVMDPEGETIDVTDIAH